MTILPPWHIFGRILELIALSNGLSIYYSSIKTLSNDMKTYAPHIMPAVPRIWEQVYNKVQAKVKKDGKEGIFNFFKDISIKYDRARAKVIQEERRFLDVNFFVDMFSRLIALIQMILLFPLKQLGQVLVFNKILSVTGGRLKFSVSGGGALPSHVDEFLNAIGIKLLEGYGLTETSPVLAVRLINRAIKGTVGPELPGTQLRLIDIGGNDVANVQGVKGTLHVRGVQVMKGY